MTTLAAPSVNYARSTLAAAFTRGTSTTIVLADGTLFPSPTPLGHVVYIHETDAITSKFCLVIYTSKAADTLTMGGGATDYALAQNVSIGDEAHEFPIGSIIDIVCAADEIAQLFTRDEAAIHDDVAGEIVAVTEKTSPIGADEIIAEDSADSKNKKRVKLSNLGSAGVPMKTPGVTTIYVDTGGNDSTGDGSSGTPYLTVNKAVAHYLEKYVYIAHDCVIAIGAGTFTLTSAIDLAGLTIPGSLTFIAQDTSDNLLYDRGTADAGGGNNELDDTSKTWDVDEWNGGWVAIIKGTGAGQVRSITDTTATKLIVSVNWTTNPDATSVYVLSVTKIDGNAAVSSCFTGTRIDNVKFTGLHITGATGWQMLNYYGFGWRMTACLVDGSTTDNGVFLSGGSFDIKGTWIRADGVGILGQYQAVLELAGSGESAVCVIAGNSGTDTGLEANYSAAIYTSTSNITFIDWDKGIYAHNNSVVGNGLGAVFVNCTTDNDPAAASDASYIE